MSERKGVGGNRVSQAPLSFCNHDGCRNKGHHGASECGLGVGVYGMTVGYPSQKSRIFSRG